MIITFLPTPGGPGRLLGPQLGAEGLGVALVYLLTITTKIDIYLSRFCELNVQLEG
jgi:hypothetical protein